jgi:hypothetical protein
MSYLRFRYNQCSLDYISKSQRERVENEEITGATLRNYVKSIKLFCDMTDVPIAWKKIQNKKEARKIEAISI